MTDQCNSSSRFLKWVRGLFWVILCIYGTVAALILGIRFILLPHVGDYKDDISGKLSERIGVRVHFDDIAPKWSSYWPILRISGLTVGDDSSRPQLTIEHAEARLSWTSFFQLSPNFQLIRLNGVDLSIARTGDASFLIGGIPLELSSGAKDSPVLNWLLNQGRIEIEGVRANYRDATQSDVQCSIDNASLSFIQDAQGWHAGVQGLFSIGETRSPVDFRIKNHSALLQTKSDWTHWRGSFFLKAPQVDAGQVLRLLKQDSNSIPVHVQDIEATAWGWYGKGRLEKLVTDARIGSLQSKSRPKIAFRQVSGRLEYETETDQFTVSSPGVKAVSSSGVPMGPIAVTLKRSLTEDHEADRIAAYAEQANIKDCADFLLNALGSFDGSDILKQLAPTGTLRQTEFLLEGEPSRPSSWELKTAFFNASLKGIPDKDPTTPGIPGGKNLTGVLRTDSNGGMVLLNSQSGTAEFPGIFEHPAVPFKTLSGTAFWQYDPKLTLTFRNMRLTSTSADVRADASWIDTGGAGTIHVDGFASRGIATSVYRFVPALVDKDIRDWLQAALLGGTASNGAVEWHGPIEDFPYLGKNAAKGRFVVTGNFRDGKLDFMPPDPREKSRKEHHAWPVIAQVDGTFLFDRDRMVFLGNSAHTNGSKLSDVYVEIPSMAANDARSDLYIHGSAAGSAQQMLDYTVKSPISGWLDGFFDPAVASGAAALKLALQIPLDAPEKTLVSGKVHLANNDVDLGNGIPSFKKASGEILFTQDSFEGRHLSATVWDIPATGTLSQTPDGSPRVLANARITPEELKRFFPGNEPVLVALDKLTGSADIDADIRVSDGDKIAVRVESNLKGLVLQFPAPLSKSPDEPWPLALEYVSLPAGQSDIHGQISNKLFVCGRLKQSNNQTLPDRLGIAYGQACAVPGKGIKIHVATEKLDATEWEKAIDPILDKTTPAMRTQSMSIPAEAVLHAQDLTILGRSFKNVKVEAAQDVTKGTPSWRLRITTGKTAGTADYLPPAGNTPGRLIARFDRLYIPKETEDKFKHLIDTVPAEDLPSMDIRIQKLTVENINLGKVSLNATATNGPRNAHLWKLNQLTAQNDAATLTANGQWRRAENENMTKLKGELKCTDGAKLLKSLSLPDGVVRGAAGTIELSLQWPGAPQEFTTRKLDGVLQADIGAGQILQAEPGVAGRFLSLISMQSLLKRLTLDFKDVFGKGYAFDNFRFKGNISNGVLETHDALVEGSAASVAIEGQTDLSAQTVRGKALVLPNINAEAGALALGIAIANPLAGLGGFLAQFVLKHPLSRLLATEYKVEGNWGNVEIEKKQTYNLNQSTEQ